MISRNIPEIRFQGYANDWEPHKFEDLFSERRDKTEEEDEDTLLSCAISGMFLNSELFSHFRGSSNIGYLKVRKNDLILSAQNLHLGNANVNLRFDHGIISPAYKVYDLLDVDPYFVQAWVKKDDTKNFFLKATTEGASGCRKNVEWKTLDKQEIFVPNTDEQKRIGEFFSQLDNLITFYQCKLNKLTNVKKTMLEKMFPQKGATIPEIRFKGFSGAWEKCELGKLGSVQTCKRIFKEQTSDKGEIPFYKNGTIGSEADAFISREIFEEFKRLYPYPEIGDTLISVVGSIGKTAEYTGKDEYFQDSNVVWLKTEGTINKKFLKISYQVIDWFIEGSTIKHLYNDNILRSIITFPSSQEEQKKIATYFEQLDNIIVFHQRKIEKLRNIKAACTDKMFV